MINDGQYIDGGWVVNTLLSPTIERETGGKGRCTLPWSNYSVVFKIITIFSTLSSLMKHLFYEPKSVSFVNLLVFTICMILHYFHWQYPALNLGLSPLLFVFIVWISLLAFSDRTLGKSFFINCFVFIGGMVVFFPWMEMETAPSSLLTKFLLGVEAVPAQGVPFDLLKRCNGSGMMEL